MENAGDIALRCPAGAVIGSLCDVDRRLAASDRYAGVVERTKELHARLSSAKLP
jgi:hypothetical protein